MSMMNVKETLKRLHKRLPTLSLDELFELLDCYVEQSSLTNFPKWDNIIWTSSPATSITSKEDPLKYTITTNRTDGKLKYYDGGGSTQLVADH
jgi:hypothetical protein